MLNSKKGLIDVNRPSEEMEGFVGVAREMAGDDQAVYQRLCRVGMRLFDDGVRPDLMTNCLRKIGVEDFLEKHRVIRKDVISEPPSSGVESVRDMIKSGVSGVKRK